MRKSPFMPPANGPVADAKFLTDLCPAHISKIPVCKNQPFIDKNGNVEATVTVSITAEGKKVISASAGYTLYPMNAEGINVKDKIGFTTAEIASFLGVTDRMIRYYKSKIDKMRKQFEAE